MTINIVLDLRRAKKDNTYPIVIWIRYGNKPRRAVQTGYSIPVEFWDHKNKKVSKKYPNYDIINIHIQDQFNKLNRELIEAKLKDVAIEDILPERKPVKKDIGIYSMLMNRYQFYIGIKKDDYASRIKATAVSVLECLGDISINKLLQDHAETLHLHLLNHGGDKRLSVGNSPNTIAKKFKMISGFLEKEKVRENPFKDYKIDKTPVVKLPLTIKEIEAIENLKLSKSLDQSRDLFLFSYYFKGMRFKDCCQFKNSNITENRIYVNRIAKSGKKISSPIHSKLKSIIQKYYNADNEYLFEFSLLKAYNQVCNNNLKKIALMAGIEKPLTFHIARHSFANNMSLVGAKTRSIQNALGHSDTDMTETYLMELDDSFLDEDLFKLYGN